MCVLVETAIEGRGVIIPMTIPFFLNISGISLPCESGAGAGDSDGFMAEITNRLKESGLLFFLWISGTHLAPITRKRPVMVLRLEDRRLSTGSMGWGLCLDVGG
ncbi:unnamed protein product [Pipistrellus nathusii]|uniref:Uncharacterized protein n=1 Tax=Pipistrellus nathusii TaxID=59473 RepID=A0ABN9ZI08_PIPNA